MGADPVFAAIAAAADRGNPLRPRDLLRFEAAMVRRLFDAGEIHKAELRFGQAVETVILPAAPPDDDDSAWSEDELQYLETAYCGGVSFAAMAAALKRPGGEILQTAWRHKWQRGGADGWGSDIPAWRIARLRELLEEARIRGTNRRDDGAGLEHRALRRAFEAGRADAEAGGLKWLPWTEAEIARLTALYDSDMTLRDIAAEMGRTLPGLVTKLSNLGLSNRSRHWTEDEDRLLVAGVERGLTTAAIAAMLPGRSQLAVKQRATKLLGRRAALPWSPEEDNMLWRAYMRGDNIVEFAPTIGRSKGGCRWRAKQLGLAHPDAVQPYSETEDRRIREGYRRGEDPHEIAADLGRTLKGVFTRAFKLGVTRSRRGNRKRVRAFEIEYIRVRVDQGWTAAEIAAKLRRGTHAVYKLANKNGIHWPRTGPRRKRAA